MKRLFEFEVITTTGAHSFQIPHTLDQPTFYTAGKLLETIEVTEDLCNNLSITLDKEI